MRTLILLSGFALAAAAQTRDLHRSFPLSAGSRVSVDTYKGSVKVTTWDKAEVDIAVRIEADSLFGGDRESVEATEIVFRSDSKEVGMKSDYSRLRRNKGWFEMISQPLVHYTIRMPQGAALRVKDYKSEIDIAGLTAELDLETYKGDIEVLAHNGPARIKHYKSSARLEFAAVPAAISMETYKGDYEVRMPRDARFDLVSRIGRHGTLDTQYGLLRQAGRSSNEFNSPVNGGGPAVTLKGYRGTYRFR